MQNLVDKTEETFGPVDILVNNGERINSPGFNAVVVVLEGIMCCWDSCCGLFAVASGAAGVMHVQLMKNVDQDSWDRVGFSLMLYVCWYAVNRRNIVRLKIFAGGR